MDDEDTNRSGYLYVKYLGNKHKSQKLWVRSEKNLTSEPTPWKVWKGLWCYLKLNVNSVLTIQMHTGHIRTGHRYFSRMDVSIIIPQNVLICRVKSRSKQFAFGIFSSLSEKPFLYLAGSSETESQRWMTNIRKLLRPRRHVFMPGSYKISMVENSHSKASGLNGFYGDLAVSKIGIFIKDPHCGEIIENFEWREFDLFHLINEENQRDGKHICVIHTTKEFRAGVGKLYVFSLKAIDLLQDLLSQGHVRKDKQLVSRPVSLSEGDLRISVCKEKQQIYPSLKTKFGSIGFVDASIALFSALNKPLRHQVLSRKIENDVEYEEPIFKPYGRTVENIYQPEPASVPNINFNLEGSPNASQNRRISNISTASGIYEKIAEDDSAITISDLYVNQILPSYQEEAPPLPPRQRSASESMKSTARNRDAQNADDSITFVIPTRQNVSAKENPLAGDKPTDNCYYVPMSPRLKDITLQSLRTQTPRQEDDYVIMR